MTEHYRCPFARALLNGHSRCKSAESFHIAERHGMQCCDQENHNHCSKLAELLHQQSRFALGITQLPQQITSNMELRIQCGGIHGLLNSISAEQQPPIDIQTLVQQAMIQFGSIEQFPYQTIIQSINQWKPRQRGRGRKN